MWRSRVLVGAAAGTRSVPEPGPASSSSTKIVSTVSVSTSYEALSFPTRASVVVATAISDAVARGETSGEKRSTRLARAHPGEVEAG